MGAGVSPGPRIVDHNPYLVRFPFGSLYVGHLEDEPNIITIKSLSREETFG